jgi:hypothetical protein
MMDILSQVNVPTTSESLLPWLVGTMALGGITLLGATLALLRVSYLQLSKSRDDRIVKLETEVADLLKFQKEVLIELISRTNLEIAKSTQQREESNAIIVAFKGNGK